MEFAYVTDPGKVRDHNEDSVIVVKNASGEYLLAVADGMGGHRGGEVASSLAISHIGKKFTESTTVGTKEEAINFIKDMVSECNLLLNKYTTEHPDTMGMGTTLVLALITKGFLLFGNLGDSSGFVIKDKKLQKITNDHTLVNLLVKSGELTPEEAKEHPNRNVLMKALGSTTSVDMDIFDVETNVEGILLCSDGLTNMLEFDQINKVLNEELSPEEKVKKLIIKANNRGGTDNISIAYLIKGGKINDRYEIIRNIGEGGMANVYLAHDTILDRDVAVKILRGDLANDEKFVRRFQREAIAASSLTHPNIVEMYDVGVDDGNYFIVMEYIDGVTLKTLIKKRGCLTIPETVDIMLQITSAIACAHDSYIIHRDIKPQNVMILDDGTAKITDFGIAMAMKSAELTQTNTVMGSVHYLPPEQANGKGATVKSDIYSLGIMMYEMLIGKVPFKGDNAVEIAMKQINEPMPSVCKQNPDIPQSIENIIIKATAKNPKNRYDSVNEMHEDLKNALNDEQESVDRVTYEYPEQELDNTKLVSDINSITKEEKSLKGEKRLNKGLVVASIIFVVLALSLLVAVIVLPKLTEVPDIAIPNIAGETVAEAEASLESAGFSVSDMQDQDYSSTIEEGKVIGVKNYNIGDVIKKGKTLTLVISSGSNQIKIENYVGKTYQEVQTSLEKAGLQVIIEKKSTTDKTTYKEDVIVSQSVSEGTTLTKGDIIRLYIQSLDITYPNFVTEGYTVDDIQSFCDENKVTLNIEYKETTDGSGTIISQSRTAGGVVKSGQSLTIVVTKQVDTSSTTQVGD